MSFCAALMPSTAALSDSPFFRLNEIVTAENCASWLIASDALRLVMVEKEESFTCAPLLPGT